MVVSSVSLGPNPSWEEEDTMKGLVICEALCGHTERYTLWNQDRRLANKYQLVLMVSSQGRRVTYQYRTKVIPRK